MDPKDPATPVSGADAEFRALLAAIVESSDDAIVSKTLDGVITSWNPGAERIFGYTAAEAVGRSISLIIPDDRKTEEDEVLARVRRGDRVDHFETIRQTKDGRRIPISLTVSPVRNASGTIVGASKVARDITERRQSEELRAQLAAEAERSRLFTRVVLAQEDERRRIARELHDQLGQQLTALRLTLEMLKAQSAERTDLRVQVETLEELARQLDHDVAFRVWELRPIEIETLGLQTALANYVGNWSQHFGVRAQLHAGRSALERVTPELEATIYRLAQEALNNIAKHARADQVDVVLERTSDQLSLIIEDNGVGFDSSSVEQNHEGVGLIGMRERAALVGAEFEIETTPSRGTTIIVRAPIAAAAVKSA